MSWSVMAIGRPVAVKAELHRQLEANRGLMQEAERREAQVNHEDAQLDLIERVLDEELDFLATQGCPAVRVSAGGSCNLSRSKPFWPGATQVNLTIEPWPNFVVEVPSV